MEINYEDNFFNEREHSKIFDYCLNAAYKYGETDEVDTPQTGLVHNIPEDEFIYKLFKKKISDFDSSLSQMKLYRMYINCFAPTENPYFHIDGEQGVTLLYYPHMEWNLNEGGETQFYIDENIYGIAPIPNRMVIFNASIMHRATTFRSSHRFTVAIKYQ
jgi:hypothetical protein